MDGNPLIALHLNLELLKVPESVSKSVKEADVDTASVIDLDVDCSGAHVKDIKIGEHASPIGNTLGTSTVEHTSCEKKVNGISLVNGVSAEITAIIDTVKVTVKVHGAKSTEASIGPKHTGE